MSTKSSLPTGSVRQILTDSRQPGTGPVVAVHIPAMTITPDRLTVPDDETVNLMLSGSRGSGAITRKPLLCRTAAGVLRFYIENGRLPIAPEGGEYLALRELRNKARAGELSAQDMATLQKVPRALEGRLTKAERYAEILRWCDENSRMPKRNFDPVNDQERYENLMAGRVSSLLYGPDTQSADHSSIKTALLALRYKYRTHREAVPAGEPGAGSGEQHFSVMAAQTLAFMAETGRRPRRHRDAEYKLGHWMQRTRRAAAGGTLSGSRALQFAPVLAAWESLPSNVSPRGRGEVHDCIRTLQSFHRSNGRLPGFSTDPEEYRALRLLRKLSKEGSLSVTEQKLAAAMPGALGRVRLDPSERLEELRRWCAANSRTPRHTIRKSALAQEEEAEQSLGQWMYRHVNRRHKDARETEATRHVRSAILLLKSEYPGIAGMTPLSRKAPAAGVAA